MDIRGSAASQGSHEQVGAPPTLYRAPANLFVAGFIGTPRIKLFELNEVRELDGDVHLAVDPATLRFLDAQGGAIR